MIPVIILILIILIAFSPFYFQGGFIGDFGDPIGQTIPNKFLLLHYLKNGLLPLWNPFSFLGFPFLADIQVGTFYFPDLVIFGFFSPFTAHTVSVLFHLIFAGIGAYFFIQHLTRHRFLALTMSGMLVLGGAFLTKIVYLNFLETISYIPWILLILSMPKMRVWLLAALFSLMIFAGHPIAFVYAFLIIVLFLLINHRKQWKILLLGLGLCFLITAIQIVPFLELKIHSVRDALSFQQFTEGSLKAQDIWGLVLPWKDGLQNPFDTYIHIGTIAFMVLIFGVVFFKYFSKRSGLDALGRSLDQKIFVTGIVLCLLGIVLSLGPNIPFVAQTLYRLPVFNLIRVPARYMILFDFGAFLAIAVFLKTLMEKYRKVAIGIMILLLFNATLLPSFFLDRHEIADAQAQYFSDIPASLKSVDESNFSLYSVPQYFLSSSFFLFPNRHILNFMPNIIGYNPLILKVFHDIFPVSPVGAFEAPDYFARLYQKFEQIGLRYYIFPTETYLTSRNLEKKKEIIDFLQSHQWQKTVGKADYDVWKSPFKNSFVYFLQPQNAIESIDFRPGKIILQTNVKTADMLIANQIYYPGWVAIDDKNRVISAQEYNGYLQSYTLAPDTKTIRLIYQPQSVIYGLVLSIIGVIISGFFFFFKAKNASKSHD